MTDDDFFVHPYIPNSVPETKKALLTEIGKQSALDIYEPIPEHLRFEGLLDVPGPIHSEAELRRHMKAILGKNRSCEENLSFLGGGTWQHSVPAAVDEVVNRAEFVSAYDGLYYTDMGKQQVKFEYASQLGELLDLEGVGLAFYDWGTVAGLSLRMASRITGRNKVLVPRSMSPERLAVVRTLCGPAVMPKSIAVELIDYDPASGEMDLGDLRAKLGAGGAKVAAVYVENPGFLGTIEGQAAEIGRIAHEHGAQFVVGVDPISLGVLASPGSYGADIACGDVQPLGVHMSCGGGLGGFIAFRDDDPVYASECPLILFTILPTEREGEYAFAEMMEERTSYGLRDKGKDWVGTGAGLWMVASAVYMTLMGPKGFQEIGDTIIKRAHYAAKMLSEIPGVALGLGDRFFKELVVDFGDTGKTVAAINASLRERGIFGGYDLSRDFPELGQSALYCVTEIHTKADIDRLAAAVREIVA
jgi:glycine dehydrogenase subunit 1